MPFFLQHTLGGSAIDGQRALASYDDYRLSGLTSCFFRKACEHALWGLIGASLLLEQGKVSAQDAGFRFSGMRHSVGLGATLRAGGFPVSRLVGAGRIAPRKSGRYTT